MNRANASLVMLLVVAGASAPRPAKAQATEVAPAAEPAHPYGPPPGYAPGYNPPPGYGTPPPPPEYPYVPPPVPPPMGIYRPFWIALGLGGGGLTAFEDPGTEQAFALTYAVRVGFGITPDWVVFLGLDGASVAEPQLSINNFVLGAQRFFFGRAYLRAGLGLSTSREDTNDGLVGDSGQGFVAGAGIELVQGPSAALGLEASSALARLPGANFWQNGLALTVSFY